MISRRRKLTKVGAAIGLIVGSIPFIDIALKILDEARWSGEPHVGFWVVVELFSSLLIGAIPMVIGAVLGGVIGNVVARFREARGAAAPDAASDADSWAEPHDDSHR